MKRFYAFIAAGLFAAAPFTVMADDWTYDFDDFSTLYGDHYAQSSFDMTINGMQWHCHGVSYSKGEDYDWFNGKQSMELYGESKKDRKKGPEISVFQSLTPRDRYGEVHCARIQSASGLAWLPGELDCRMVGRWQLVE